MDKIESHKRSHKRAKLYLTGISPEVTNDDVKDVFSIFGSVTGVTLEPCPASGKKTGSVQFEKEEHARKALLDMNTKLFRDCGDPIGVRSFLTEPVLWVYNLPPEASRKRLLQDAFGQFGELEEVRIVHEDPGRHLRGAYVTFKRKRNASIALQYLLNQNFILAGGSRPVLVDVPEYVHDDDDINSEVYAGPGKIAPAHFAQATTFEFEWAVKWRRLVKQQSEERKGLEQLHRSERIELLSQIRDAEALALANVAKLEEALKGRVGRA